jgi:microfibrillar-associated protein 1
LRVKRDRDERTKFLQEKNEILRRRAMTEEERQAEDEKLGADHNSKKQQVAYNFMQKYYHKGAFYMDETEMDDKDVRKREMDGATLEDKFDKQALPKVMQVKKFGFSGQTKYTHLKDQDTTDFDNPWNQKNELRADYDSKMAGIGDIDSAGRKRK